MRCSPFKKVHKRNHAAFTLVEAMLAVLIVGLGIAALMHLFASGTRVNDYGDKLSKAVFLAQELRAMTDDVPTDDIIDLFDDQAYNGVDAQGNAVAGLQEFWQKFQIEELNEDLQPFTGGPILRITATVGRDYDQQNNQVSDELTSISWLRAR